jgi:hypothetical protein
MNTDTTDAARELYLYAINHAATWQQIEAIARNYERKRAKSTYDSALAAKGLIYAAETAAKAYVRDHCDSATKWHDMFKPSDRVTVAALLRDDMESEWDAGNGWTVA